MLKKQSKRARNEKVQGKKSKKLKKEQAKARKRQLKVQKIKKDIMRNITLLHRFHIIAHDMLIDDIGGID